MEKSLNPAFSFSTIFEKALTIQPIEGNNQVSSIEGWKRTFNLDNNIDVFHSIWRMDKLYQDLFNCIDKLEDQEQKDLQLATVLKIPEIIGSEYITQPWQYVVSKISGIRIELKYLALNMNKDWLDKRIDSSKLETWRKELLDVLAEMESDKSIEIEVRLLFVKLIKELINAINQYILWGNDGISDIALKLGFFLTKTKQSSDSPSIAKFKKVMAGIWLGVQAVSCVLQIAGYSGKDLFIGE